MTNRIKTSNIIKNVLIRFNSGRDYHSMFFKENLFYGHRVSVFIQDFEQKRNKSNLDFLSSSKATTNPAAQKRLIGCFIHVFTIYYEGDISLTC